MYSPTSADALIKLFVTVAVLLSVAVCPPVMAQNLVPNAEFDHDVAGWESEASDFLVVHRSDVGSDLVGGSGPGCLEAQHFFWNGGLSGTEQVVGPVVAGATYDLKGSYYLPTEHNSEENVANHVAIYVYWKNSSGWNAGSSDNVYAWPIVKDTWTRLEAEFVAPPEAVSAEIRLMVGNPNVDDETRPGVVFFDDIWFSELGIDTATQMLFVPAGASVHGNAGTFWSTNGWFSNMIEFPVTLSGAFLRQGQDNSAALNNLTELGVIPPEGFLEIEDVVGLLGGVEVAGGIYLKATAMAGGLPATLIYGTTHTFTPNPDGGGVYGQGLAAVGAGSRNMVVVPGLYQSAAFRTNVGALNTSAETIDIRVEIRDADGVKVVNDSWTLQPYEHRQKSLSSLGTGVLEGGTLVLTRLSDAGSFRGYTSTVDQASGDAVYNEAR